MNAIAIQAPRLPYHPAVAERFGIDQGGWRVLTDAVFPAAERPESIIMALAYCRARNLDIFKKPVQIVPIYDKKRGGMVDTVWPGIAELRTTAMRTGTFAGFDETEFGPIIEETLGGVAMRYPEWAQCTVYRLVAGQRVPFIGPKVYWLETYATAKRDTKAPNSMWAKRPRGQIEKCAEAAALRRAFPEEIGNEYAAEEIEGQAFGQVRDVTPRDTPNLAARLSAPKADDAPAEGFTVHNALGDDDIPEFDAGSPAASDEPSSAEQDAPAGEGDFPGDGGTTAGPAEANADEGSGSAVDLVAWQESLLRDMDGLSLEQIEHLLNNPSDQEIFLELNEKQPSLAVDLNKAIGRRKRELGA